MPRHLGLREKFEAGSWIRVWPGNCGGGLGDLIARLYRVRLTEQGVGTYLRWWGPSFQRPDKRAVGEDAEAVRVWRGENWPAIRAKAKAEGGEELFAHQVGIRSDQVTGRTWGAKGRTPVVRRTGNRFSVNAISAISTKGSMNLMVFTGTFDADLMCRFPDRLAGVPWLDPGWLDPSRPSGVSAGPICTPMYRFNV
ncbi:helix-turn-helix domain-containing protein [Streptomyces sp. CMB-StM0423]|uniref:helix-turn-helix domain-containing protein n=1 Tax=Streptomyces sp. CMB-StM0423 TaxID=2059884 RepID=UPI003FA3C1F4